MPTQTRRSLLRSAAALAAAPLAGSLAAAAELPAQSPALEMTPIGSQTPVPLPAPEFLRAGDWLQFKVKTPFSFDPEATGLEYSNLYEYRYSQILEIDPEINRLVLSEGMPVETVEINLMPRIGLTDDCL